MKRIAVFLILLTSIQLLHSSSRKYLVIEMKNDLKSRIAIEKNPVITCSEGEIVVTIMGEIIAQCSMEDGVIYTESDANTTSIKLNEVIDVSDRFFVENTPGTFVQIYTLSGHLVKVITPNNKGTAKIDLSNLEKGFYVVKTSGGAFKYFNR